MQNEIDMLMKQALKIYLQSCTPHIMYSMTTGKVAIEYIWINPGAETTYNILVDRVQELIAELRRKQEMSRTN